MTSVALEPLPRIACFPSMTPPVITAGGMLLGTQTGLQSYMPDPWAQGDITWQGAEFGFTAPGGTGVQVQRIRFALTHRVSSLAAFTSAKAQVYDGSTPVGSPYTLSMAVDYVTDTFYLYSGYPAADLPSLALRVTYHSVAPGIAYVNSVYAEAATSPVTAITPFPVACTAAFPAPQPHVTLPRWRTVAVGNEANSLSPQFAQATGTGNLLIAWVFSNSGSASFDTTCPDPSWTAAGHGGAAFGWLSLWYKAGSSAGETAPVFSTPATAPMSQLAEFATGTSTLDQSGSATGTASVTVSASAPDTRSGNLVVTAVTWGGANAGPTTVTFTGTDSAGTPVTAYQSQNSSSAGTQFYCLSWGQAGQAFAPGTDTATAALGIFEGSVAVTASFTVTGVPALAQRQFAQAGITQRAVTRGIRIG